MGGGKSPSISAPPEVEPMPTPETAKEPVVESVRNVGVKRLMARRGHAGNIFTDPLGQDQVTKLGRMFT